VSDAITDTLLLTLANVYDSHDADLKAFLASPIESLTDDADLE
jgi:hypothetical protein